MSTLEENLRVAQPEIEPLHKNKKDDRSNSVKVPIAEDSNDSNKVYNNTTEEKPTVRLRNVIRQVSNLHRFFYVPVLLKRLNEPFIITDVHLRN